MRLNKNLASMNVYRNYIRTLDRYSSSIEKISSGKQLNKAKDNPNKLAQSERLRLQVRSLEMSSRNAQDAVSMIQSADGVLNSITDSLKRLRNLAVQGGTDTLSSDDKKNIDLEIDQILNGIQSMAGGNDFNGVNLIGDESIADNKNPKLIKVTIGGNIGETATLEAYNVTAKGLGLMDSDGKTLVDLNNTGDTLKKIDSAIETVLSVRVKSGAKQNRFESMYNNLIEIRDRNTEAESAIRDTDVAEESMKLAKNDILINASNSIMAQTNKFPREILRVLESVRGR
ncbi:flagellin [Oceanirhabdus seepicola]|uniref:Flagellin n=1 Tax=Oceanirhabdus seepicola TaxID=2828781 RepID=A0A9J6PDU0_9CLOT|nr:flagellin [Oceanirhabdus seepicola]MCM1992632.1 flagellin [Oceanirhabdus seepicola]